jgi:hypothetical protein
VRFNIFAALRFLAVRALVGNGYFAVIKATGVDVDIRPNTKLFVMAQRQWSTLSNIQHHIATDTHSLNDGTIEDTVEQTKRFVAV